MTDRSPDPEARFSLRLRLARAALLWERVWPACWPALAALGVFFAVGLFDLLPRLPGLLHAALLLGFGAAFVIALAVANRGVAVPDQAVARRRIELESGLEHRPMQALADRPAAPLDTQSTQLWQAHRRRMEAATRRLRVGFPAARFAGCAGRRLRVVLLILLLLGTSDAGIDWRDRLARALTPALPGGSEALAGSLDIWVTPPEYTGLPPQSLRAGTGETVRLPVRQAVAAQVPGGASVAPLTTDVEVRDFDAVDKQNFRLAAKLTVGKQLKVSQAGAVLGNWSIEIIPDNPPKAPFAKSPEATTRAALRIDYQTSDDYGVEAVKAIIRREGGKPDETIEIEEPLPGLHLKEAQATNYHD